VVTSIPFHLSATWAYCLTLNCRCPTTFLKSLVLAYFNFDVCYRLDTSSEVRSWHSWCLYLFLSWLDYCNSILANLPLSATKRVLNAAALPLWSPVSLEPFNHVIRGRPNAAWRVSADTETRPKLYTIYSAESESRPKVHSHFRPKPNVWRL